MPENKIDLKLYYCANEILKPSEIIMCFVLCQPNIYNEIIGKYNQQHLRRTNKYTHILHIEL